MPVRAQPVAEDIIKLSSNMLEIALAQDFLRRTLKKVMLTIAPYIVPYLPTGRNPINMVTKRYKLFDREELQKVFGALFSHRQM
jgi:hypothetical protein